MLRKLAHLKKREMIRKIETDINYIDKIVFVVFLLLYTLITGVLLGVIFN